MTSPSLLLLSDFHPRSMHFPPGGEDDELMAPTADQAATDGDELDTPLGVNGTFAGWTEPALRSDRMTWSLIGLSHALAYELGIFGNYTDGLQIVDGRVKRQGGPLKYHKRADRIERLLYIYITQACGRFGFPSLFPDHVNKFQIAAILDRNYSSGMHNHSGFQSQANGALKLIHSCSKVKARQISYRIAGLKWLRSTKNATTHSFHRKTKQLTLYRQENTKSAYNDYSR